MDKMALADRFEGYSKIFASDSNMGIDLKAMADTLREMPEEKFAKVVDAGLLGGIGKGVPMMHSRTPMSERPYNIGEGPEGKAKMIPEKGLTDIAKKHSIPAEKMKSIYQDIMEAAEAASEEVEACKEQKDSSSEAWTKSASDFVAQNLVRDILGMEKSICCDTKRHQTPKQMPDAKKTQEIKGAVDRAEDTGAALKPEQVPHLDVKLNSDMFKKSKGPVRKEAAAAAEENPESEAAEKQDMKDAGKVEDPAKIAEKVKKMEEEKKKKELEEKSRPKKEESEVEANTIVAEGIEFDNVMQEVDANDEDVKKLSALFE